MRDTTPIAHYFIDCLHFCASIVCIGKQSG